MALIDMLTSALIHIDCIHLQQGASKSMPWLAELVESSEGSMDILPVQCLCEFLLHDSPSDGSRDYDDDEDKSDRQKRRQVSHKPCMSSTLLLITK